MTELMHQRYKNISLKLAAWAPYTVSCCPYRGEDEARSAGSVQRSIWSRNLAGNILRTTQGQEARSYVVRKFHVDAGT